MPPSSAPAPAAPTHLLRSHAADVTALAFSPDNERLYSGDASGRVVVTSTRTLRPIAAWPAHTDGILGVQEWGARVVTHSRDHTLNVWDRVQDLPAAAAAASALEAPAPALRYSLAVNALNYCRFSLLPSAPDLADADADAEDALLALPNLVESSEADIWALPSRARIHASVGTQRTRPLFTPGPHEGAATGLIMALHLFRASASSAPSDAGELRLLCAYEDGSVALRRYGGNEGESSVEGRGWDVVWRCKLHGEAVMAMRVARGDGLALTVSADHLVGRYDLAGGDASAGAVFRTKHPGNGCVAIRDDGRVCAIGGWDGRIRLYSTKSMKPLGTLRYHKSGCQAVEFARTEGADEGSDSEDEMSADERATRGRWLAAGSKDQRVSLWALISFGKDE